MALECTAVIVSSVVVTALKVMDDEVGSEGLWTTASLFLSDGFFYYISKNRYFFEINTLIF